MTAAEGARKDPRANVETPRPVFADSWLDWLIASIRAAPGPTWVWYPLIFAALGLLGHLAGWLGGTSQPGTLDPLILVQATFLPLILAWIRTLDAVALRSLRILRPAIPAGDDEVAAIGADLTRTPRRRALVAGLAGVSFSVASVLADPETYRLHAGVAPAMYLWAIAFTSVAAAVAAATVTHVVHQAGVVMRVHRNVRVDLFALDPLYAFANLTAVIGIAGVVLAAYAVGALSLIGVRFSLVETAWFGAAIPIAIALFVVPLLGLHARIQAEKERRHAEAGQVLETAIAELNRRIRANDLSEMSQLNDAVDGATTARATISNIQTWPWRRDTFRGFVGAVCLPILIWAITAFLGRLF